MIDSLKDLKDIYDVVRTAIDRGREPKQELITISAFVQTLVSDPTILTSKVDKDYRRYFQDDFSTGLLKRLTREKSNDEKYLEIIATIFESYMQLFQQGLKEGIHQSYFLDNMKGLFEYDCLLHAYNYQMSEEQLKAIRLKGQVWRNEIKEGDMVDANQDELLRCQGWSQAQVVQVAGDVLSLQFPNDTKTSDKLIDRNSLDLAPFESKTKQMFEWKSTLKVGDLVDGCDKNMWNKGTILDISESQGEKKYKVVYIGYRIYGEKGSKSDEKGNYEGYSSKQDEWIPLYSPRIQPFYTKTQKTYSYDDYTEIDDDFDPQYPCEEGHSRVYAVPRIKKCTSKLFIHLMNQFGNQGGFDQILEIIRTVSSNCTTQEDLNLICSLVEMVSRPYLVYHKEFQKEYFPKIIGLVKTCILTAPDKCLRDINREKLEGVIRSIDNMQKRNLTKEERDKESEIFKLDICLLCLKSGFLERRIQGIKDLNQLIRNNRIQTSKTIPNAVLIQWLKDNDVFSIIFDPKRTHLQIVQRTNDILKLLLAENELSPHLFDMFWNLSKSDYKVEVYKILNDIAFYLKKENFEFILAQIIGNQGNLDKISIDDYQCLSEMAKYAKDEDFKVNVNRFFWNIIIESNQLRMGQLIVTCLNFIRTNKITIYKSYNSAAAPQSEQIQTNDTSTQDMEKAIIEAVLNNLTVYCQQVREKVSENPALLTETRKKMFLIHHKYSHHDEIDERLQFIKYVASFSFEFKITKEHLARIYDLLVKHSLIPSDQEEFLIWCRSLCESSSLSKSILDLTEVGEFFTEKMKSKELDIKSLPNVGFEFLQHYFLSVNEKASKLLKSSGKSKQSKFVSGYNFNNYGVYLPYQKTQKQDEDEKQPVFKLLTTPEHLDQLDIVWNVALHCENPKVVPKAINFLIKVYYQLDEDLNEQKIKIQNEFIHKCMAILDETKDEFTLNRVIEIIKHIIYEAEKKGTGDVQPHNAVLKGELLERIQIKYKASQKKNNIIMSIYSNTTVWEFKKEVSKQLDLAPKYLRLERYNGQALKDLDNGKTLAEIGIQSYENLSASKLYIEEEIANAPLIGPDNKLTEKAKQIFSEWFIIYSDEQGAMTKETCSLFIKGCTGEQPGVNDERILGVFNQYDSNKDGRIEKSEFLQFYENAARSKPDTVRENLKAHNVRADLKKLSEIQEESSFSAQDMPRFKISENQEYFDKLMVLLDREDSVSQTSWDLIQMLATNRIIYRRVLQLKTAINEATNKIDWSKFFDSQSVYKLLYTLQIIEAVMEEGEGSNLERIVIIQDGEPQKKQPPAPPLQTGEQGPAQASKEEAPVIVEKAPAQEQAEDIQPVQMKKTASIVEDVEDQKLKSDWTAMFLQNDGILYILKVFMDKEIKVHTHNDHFNQVFELKHIAFLLKLLRIFIMAAFSTSKESQVYQVANMVRRSSSIQEDSEANQASPSKQNIQNQSTEGSRFKELQTLLEGPLGENIIEQIDYKLLQQKILRVIAQVLSKNEMIFEDKLIIENALSLWVGCVLHRNELFNEFYNFKGAEEDKIRNCDSLILHGLLFCPYEKVRDEFRQSLSSISLKLSGSSLKQDNALVIDPLKYLLRLLSENITEISKYHSKQYFDLFCSIIEYYFMIKSFGYVEEQEHNSFNPEQLLSHIIDKIKEYNQMAVELNEVEVVEEEQEGDSSASSELESVYIGLIQLTSKIIDNFDISLTAEIVEKKSLIEEIFVKFLFATVFKDGQTQKEIKIQPKKQRKTQKKQTFGKKSKDAAYKLINSLIRRSPLLMNNFLDKSLIPLMNAIRRLDIWNYSPAGGSSGSSDKSQKYVGLRNLGCICYMNSMLQQFFMIPAFRYNLLCVDDHTKEDLREYKGFNIDDNMLHQLQKLMAHLELSERSEYNPFEFCFSFKEMDGNPTNTGEQKDAQEFLNLAFDRIETMLKTTSRKYLLQSVFGGQTCSQLVCQECGKVKNRIEDFYNLSLTVKDIKSMHESLQKLVEGEVINDFSCEGCGKKVDISKRTLISQTPNVLIVHLQRIVFNFDSFKNDKLNTYFEFPYQLDLKPYSFYEVMKKENRIKTNKEGEDEEVDSEQPQPVLDEDNQWPTEEDCFEYKLVGATVHSGTANAGHYWSYINTRRGYLEPDESDPNWNKTENEPWMEFNDSRVSEFNFDKLKDECFGDQNKSSSGSGGDEGGWSSWGNYGKSAYMLVYERKKKRPIKIVVSAEEAEAQKESCEIIYDEKKEEHYKLIDYREGVEDIAPNQIYKQVHEDNKKFEFDNDIYSQEFFEFVKSILQAALTLAQESGSGKHQSQLQLLGAVNQKAVYVGKKAILEILSKCFYNQTIRNLVEILIEIMKTDEDLCFAFMHQCYMEDNFEYLLMIMLECPDAVARLNVAILVKFILNKLKVREKDVLYQVQRNEYKQENGEIRIEETPLAMTSKFMVKCLDNLNTLVAKNWARFDYFLDMLSSFALGESDSADDKIGLEFLFRQQFIGKACDFLLGRKSPLATPQEKRFEMGGSYSSPNFSSVLKIITRMINDTELIQQYPLTETEKKLLLQHDLLKVMLGQSSGSKQFGQCLANLCKNNLKYSKKVSKIFIKVINGSAYDNVKNYLKALKPFLRLDDDLKTIRLEWIFGFAQILNKKEYRDDKFKFGLELIQKVNDDTYTFISPITNAHNEEALLFQLLKCKGRLDTFAINCLKEMLSLMAKDDVIARFIYAAGAPSYQYAHYFDWIKPYLEGHKAELEKTSSYSYMKAKYDTVIKALQLYSQFEEKCVLYSAEEQQAYDQFTSPDNTTDFLQAKEDFLAYQNGDVIKHFPPQLIIGKQTGEERDIRVIDEDPLARVTLTEIVNEYNYSNPTGFFNLSLPHIEMRTNMYSTMSYSYFKKMMHENELNAKRTQKKYEEEKLRESQEIQTTNDEIQAENNPQEETKEEEKIQVDEERPVFQVRDWYENKKEGSVLLRVCVANKSNDTIKFRVTLKSDDKNIKLPQSFLTDTLYQSEMKYVGYFQKLDPSKPWPEIQVELQAIKKTYGSNSGFSSIRSNGGIGGDSVKINVYDQTGTLKISDSGEVSVIPPKTISCMGCKKEQSASNFTCIQCGNYISSGSTYNPQYDESLYSNYYG